MAGTGTGACPSPRSRMSHTTRFSPDRSRRRAMKLLMALALASLPLPALAQAPAAADTDGKTAAGVQYVPPKDWTATTRDRKSVVEGKSVSGRVDLGGRRNLQKKNRNRKIKEE